MAFPLTLLIYILSILTLVFAQPPWQNWPGFDGMSNCGQTCFFQNIRGSGCQFPNFGCVCSAEDFIPNLTTCANGQCNATEVGQVLQAANSLCDSNSVDTSTSIRPSTSGLISARTSQVSARTQTRQSTLSTLTTRPSTQSDDTSITMSDVSPSASGTAPPSETQSTPSTTNGATAPIGAIVGGVIGGFGGVSLILAMVWLIMREKNRGARIKAFPRLMPQPPHTNQVEEQSQSIWDGQQAFKWNPQTRRDSTAELPAG